MRTSDASQRIAMADAKPPVVAELIWADALRFGATSGTNAIVVDGDSAAGPSPAAPL